MSGNIKLQTQQPVSLGRAIDGSQVGGHLIDIITTTLSPIVTGSIGLQDELTTMASVQASPIEANQESANLDSFYGLFKHMDTPSDCATLINAFLASFSVIMVSELGDKTFIITAIMAMKNSRLLVFLSSATALLLMTILSVGMGVAVTVIPKLYTHWASIVLFLCFGLKMLKEAYDMGADEEPESEFDEVQRTLEDEESYNKIDGIDGSEKGWRFSISRYLHLAPIVIKVFTMIFVAEWGDRSQIGTVILATREDVVGVFIGSFTGHVLCTGLAVIGGRFIADIISVKTMTFLGGLIFLFFAVLAILTGPE